MRKALLVMVAVVALMTLCGSAQEVNNPKFLGITFGQPVTQITECPKSPPIAHAPDHYQPYRATQPCWATDRDSDTKFKLYGLIPSKEWPWFVSATTRDGKLVYLQFIVGNDDVAAVLAGIDKKLGPPTATGSEQMADSDGKPFERQTRVWKTDTLFVRYHSRGAKAGEADVLAMARGESDRLIRQADAQAKSIEDSF